AVLAAQPLQHDPDFVLCREVPARRTPYVLHHPLSWGLRRRFFQGGFGLHLRSFVTTTKPKSSLNHSLKSVPLALTADNQERRPGRKESRSDKYLRPEREFAVQPGEQLRGSPSRLLSVVDGGADGGASFRP